MDGGPEFFQRLEMLRHAVAHMPLETVAGMCCAETYHQPVPRHLCDDRGRRDRHHQCVAGDHRLTVAADIDLVAAVDEDESRPHRQRPHRVSQRPKRCLQDIVAVDARDRAERDRHLRGGADLLVEPVALLTVELLGIVQPTWNPLRVKHHGSGNHRPRERTAPRFVTPRNRKDAALDRRAFAAKCRPDDSIRQIETRDFGGG